MFELPEYLTLSRQFDATLKGLSIQQAELGNTPHKFVWYNRSREEFSSLMQGKRIGVTQVRGRWMCTQVEPGYVLVLGECGGKVLYHEARNALPQKYHLMVRFEDGGALTVMTTMWGAMELYAEGEELERPYIKDMRPTPVDAAFTLDYFEGLVDALVPLEKRSLKSLLTQDQLIPGLGNAIAQDILFTARLHPRHSISDLDQQQRRQLFEAITGTVEEVARLGGRYDETDLFNQPGGYVRLMDKNALRRPCPGCGGAVEKIQYLGGACYFCPVCQV